MRPLHVLLGVVLASSPSSALHAQEPLPLLPPLDSYDWTRWLVGEWEGWLEQPDGRRVRQTQSFTFDVDSRFLITRLRQEVASGQWYTGTGMFQYDPASETSVGHWFGIVGDRNIGLGRRDGDRWVWEIQRDGRPRVLRIRQRIGNDEYRMTNTSVAADGTRRVTTEVMRRVKSGETQWAMPPEYRAVQLASLESQRRFLHAMADSMPESLYADPDHPGQRSFAGHVYHAAVANAQAVSRFIGTESAPFKAPDETVATASRTALKAAIDGAFDFMTGLLLAQPDTARNRPLDFAGRTITAWQFWDELDEHTSWTLGEMVGNFRKHGMPPPAFRFF